MTAVTPMAGQDRSRTLARNAVRWRPLIGSALRQHRAGLAACGILGLLVAIAMAVTGLVLHVAGPEALSAGPHSLWRLFNLTFIVLRLALPLLPVLAGLFLGAPTVARELETGSARFAWTQAAGRTRLLLAGAIPMALLIAAAALGLGLEFRWWLGPLRYWNRAWRPDVFGLNPLPYVGWMLFGFSLAVFLGAVIRRTVPTMAATLACYLLLLLAMMITRWRDYLPPLRRAVPTTFTANGGWSFGVSLSAGRGPGANIIGQALGWPNGRLLSPAELGHSAAWFRLHHIQVWLSYQPASRFGLFELIEFGWLAAASALLIAATVLLIRRRAT